MLVTNEECDIFRSDLRKASVSVKTSAESDCCGDEVLKEDIVGQSEILSRNGARMAQAILESIDNIIRLVEEEDASRCANKITTPVLSSLNSVPNIVRCIRRQNRGITKVGHICDRILDRSKRIVKRKSSELAVTTAKLQWFKKRRLEEDCAGYNVEELQLSETDFAERFEKEDWFISRELDSHQFLLNMLQMEKLDRETAWNRYDALRTKRVQLERDLLICQQKESDLPAAIVSIVERTFSDLSAVCGMDSSECNPVG